MNSSNAWISGILICFALAGSTEALSCPSNAIYEPSPGHKICYTFIDNDVLGETADASCKQITGGHAVQIFNADIFNFLKNLPSDFFKKGEYWVGIKPPHWIWLDRNDSLVLNNAVWIEDRPDMTKIHRQRCVASDEEGWVDADCKVLKGFLCNKAAFFDESMNTLSCGDASYTLYESVCYKHYSSPTNFFTAMKNCEAVDTTLARLDTKRKVERVLPKINTISSPVWFGLYAERWTWMNGSAVTYFPWKSGEPNDWEKECVLAKLGDDHAWSPEPCDNGKGLLCERVVSYPCTPTDLKYARRRGQKISQDGLFGYSVAARSIMNCVTICTTQHGCQCTAVEYSASSGQCTVLQGAVVDVDTKFVAAAGVDTMIILNGLH